MVSRHFQNVQHNYEFERQREDARRKMEAEDLALRQAAERERRGLPSQEEENRQQAIEEHNAAVRERQRQYFEEQKQPPAQPQSAQYTKEQLAIRDAYLQFRVEEPQFLETPENFKGIVDYILDHGLPEATVASYHRAFDVLRQEGKLQTRQARAAVSVTAPAPAPAVNEHAGQMFCPGDQKWRTEAELDMLSADEFARVMRIRRGDNYEVRDGVLIDNNHAMWEIRR